MPNTHEISHFSLQGILEPQYSLAVDRTSGLVALLALKEGRSSLEASMLLTPSELCILLPLLESYPYYCPYDVLLASLAGQPTEQDIARAKERLEDALDEGTWDIEIRPVRNILSRTRIKIRALGITILSIIETGYILDKFHRRSLSNIPNLPHQ
jgi:hypothetical protein